MLNCHDATRLMSDSQERTLKLGERFSLKMHVSMCAGCRNGIYCRVLAQTNKTKRVAKV